VFSCTKGATALCAHVLASRGKLDLDAPVVELWPEFGQHGKERVTTRMMLDHSSAVPALRAPVKDSGPFEGIYMTARLADEVPFWPPGTRNGYHGFTFGWTVGEMVRRASASRSARSSVKRWPSPLGLDFWIGLPEKIEPRVAPITPHVYKAADAVTPSCAISAPTSQSIASLFFFNVGGWRTKGANARESHAAEIGAANGVTNARGLAGMYAPLANGGGKLVDGRRWRAWAKSRWPRTTTPPCAPHPLRAGLHESMDNRKRSLGAKLFGEDVDSVILGSAAFGHVGAGGSLGFADPAAGLSFGYTMTAWGRAC